MQLYGTRKTLLYISIMLAFASHNVFAEDKLDMSFIQGGEKNDADAWATLNSNNIPGRYLVDVTLNGESRGRKIIDISPKDKDSLCLTNQWLTDTGIYIRSDYFKETEDVTRQCYFLSKAASVGVQFDVASQQLNISVPQLALGKEPVNTDWDYGAPAALRMNYNANGNTSRTGNTIYGSTSLNANLGRWVLNSTASLSQEEGGNDSEFSVLTASRALKSLQADLTLGKIYVGDGVLGGVGTYGVSLSRNNSMDPNNQGYSPVFRGIAKTHARITLTQAGRTLYSEILPPGPFAITDVSFLTSGDVDMTVLEEDGSVSRQNFPLTLTAGILRSGQHEFSFSAGQADSESDIKGELVSASYGYGLDWITLRGAMVLHSDYQGLTAGVTSGLGKAGAMTLEAGATRYREVSTDIRQGRKLKLSWTRQFDTGTGLQASWSGQSSGWESLGGQSMYTYRDGDNHDDQYDYYKRAVIRNEINFGINQRLDAGIGMGLSAWQRDYWNNGETSRGLSASLSGSIKRVSVSLGLTGSRQGNGDNNYSAGISVSVPFTLFDKQYSSYTNISTGTGGGAGISTGVSGALNERFSYSVGASQQTQDNYTQVNSSAAYSGDKASVSGSLSQSEYGTTGSLSVNGSVLALPEARSVIFSRTISDTVAVVNVKDTQGVRLLSGTESSDSNGNLVVPLSSYNYNTLTVDTGTVPIDTELTTTSQGLVPSSGAVVWVPFSPVKVQRYLLQVKRQDGQFMAGGTWAFDQNKTPLGFVAQSGVLMINTLDTPGDIHFKDCVVPENRIKKTVKLQEVVCE